MASPAKKKEVRTDRRKKLMNGAARLWRSCGSAAHSALRQDVEGLRKETGNQHGVRKPTSQSPLMETSMKTSGRRSLFRRSSSRCRSCAFSAAMRASAASRCPSMCMTPDVHCTSAAALPSTVRLLVTHVWLLQLRQRCVLPQPPARRSTQRTTSKQPVNQSNFRLVWMETLDTAKCDVGGKSQGCQPGWSQPRGFHHIRRGRQEVIEPALPRRCRGFRLFFLPFFQRLSSPHQDRGGRAAASDPRGLPAGA